MKRRPTRDEIEDVITLVVCPILAILFLLAVLILLKS